MRGSWWRTTLPTSPAGAVLLLALGAVVASGALWFSAAGLHGQTQVELTGVGLLALCTAAADLTAFPVPARRRLHTVGVHAGVLAVGLMLVPTSTVVLGVVLGVALSAAVLRDVPPWRVAADTAGALLGAVGGAVAFEVLVRLEAERGRLLVPASGRGAWAAVIAALVAAALWRLTALAVSATAGHQASERLVLRLAAATAASSLAAGGVGGAAVVLWTLSRSWTTPLLLLAPTAGCVLLGAAAVRGRRAAGDLDVLARASALSDDDPARALLAAAVEGLGAARGELLLCGTRTGRRRTGRTLSLLHFRDERSHGGPAPDALAAAVLPALRDPVLLPTLPGQAGGRLPALAPELGRFLLARGYTDLVSAPVQVGGQVVGALAVSGRDRGARRFDSADLRLVGALAAQLGQLLSDRLLQQRLAEAERDGRELQERLGRDELTGLARRSAFMERLELALSQRDVEGTVAVLYLDLDGFKQLNDRHGHAAGDTFLAATGERLSGLLRGGDLAARLGGDEFAVLVLGLTGQDRATLVAARILDALSMPVDHEGTSLRVGTSVGVALAQAGETAQSLLKAADTAMYVAKRSSGARWSMADEDRTARARPSDDARLALLVQGLQAPDLPGALEVHYQPRLDPATGRVVGVEALVRWRHPALGLVPPGEFVPLADRLGRMVGLGHDVLATALQQVRAWDGVGPDGLAVSVNLTDAELRDDGLTESVRAALQAAGLPGSRLLLEVGAGAFDQQQAAVRESMSRLSDLGVRFTLDGFGVGSFPLGRLDQLPLHAVKIPAAVLAQPGASGTSGLSSALVGLARSLGLAVAVEGVERADQASRLLDLACDEVQGFHYGRPEPASAGHPLMRQQQQQPAD